MNYEWVPVRTRNFGLLHYPVVATGVKRKSGEWALFNFLFDSGADVTMMRAADCEYLGLDLESGKRMEFATAGESSVWAYLHEVMFKFGRFELPVRVAFAEKGVLRMPLLGRLDITDFFDINLQGRAKRTTFTR